jgi:hypothetical protein
MSAVLEPAGSGVAGVQTQGVTKQYQASATGSSASTLETIGPYDSGTILGNVPPGKSGEKLINGTVQRASQVKADSTAGVTGNALVVTSGVGVLPTLPSGSLQSDGLSQYAARE